MATSMEIIKTVVITVHSEGGIFLIKDTILVWTRWAWTLWSRTLWEWTLWDLTRAWVWQWWHVMVKRPFDYTKYDWRRYTLHKLLHSRKPPKIAWITQKYTSLLAYLKLFMVKNIRFWRVLEKNCFFWTFSTCSKPKIQAKDTWFPRSFHDLKSKFWFLWAENKVRFCWAQKAKWVLIWSGFHLFCVTISGISQHSCAQYTILHITQTHVFMTCHHWINRMKIRASLF